MDDGLQGSSGLADVCSTNSSIDEFVLVDKIEELDTSAPKHGERGQKDE